MRRVLSALAVALLVAACSDESQQVVAPDFQLTDALSAAGRVVYTSTNAADGNAILVFHRTPDGLALSDEVATGGVGTGGGLGNQGAVALSRDGRRLFVVNAGDNSVSGFRVTPGGLELAGVAPSGGEMPVSLALHGRLLYVLNAAGAGSISGFEVGSDAALTPLAESMRPLSGADVTGPAQVAFRPDGRLLAVTEKATNQIVTYVVGRDGRPGEPQVHASSGMTPFGFAFGPRGTLIVSEAFGGAEGASAVSSYAAASDGSLTLISASVPDNQSAACWVAVTKNGRFAYTTNTGSGSVSGYRVGLDGALTLLDADGRTGVTGDGTAPIDLAFSRGSRFLFVLNSGNGTIAAFEVMTDGSLEARGLVDGIPAGSTGLAAR